MFSREQKRIHLTHIETRELINISFNQTRKLWEVHPSGISHGNPDYFHLTVPSALKAAKTLLTVQAKERKTLEKQLDKVQEVIDKDPEIRWRKTTHSP